MTSTPTSAPTYAPVSGSEITDFLPPKQWATELLYHCLRSHEERVKELKESRPGYDPQAAQRAIEASRADVDLFLLNHGLTGLKRELVFSYWDRGLQSDAIDAVRLGFAEKIRTDPDNWNGLMWVLLHFVKDPQYQSEGGLRLYGGASLCMQIAHESGRDPNDLLREVAALAETAPASAN